jgi:hypothetical protein
LDLNPQPSGRGFFFAKIYLIFRLSEFACRRAYAKCDAGLARLSERSLGYVEIYFSMFRGRAAKKFQERH